MMTKASTICDAYDSLNNSTVNNDDVTNLSLYKAIIVVASFLIVHFAEVTPYRCTLVYTPRRMYCIMAVTYTCILF